MPENNFNIKGLSDEQVILAREKFGQAKLQEGEWNSRDLKKSGERANDSLITRSFPYLFCKWKNWRWNFSFLRDYTRFLYLIVSRFKKSKCSPKTKKFNST